MTFLKQWLCGCTAALVFAAATIGGIGSSPAVRAAETEAPEATPGNSARTEVGIAVSSVDPETVSFEVPLYVTMAVQADSQASGVPIINCPDNYSIINTTPPSGIDGKVPDLGVTGITVKPAPGGSWSLYSDLTGAADGEKALSLTIGGLRLPDMKAGGREAKAELTAGTSVFYDSAAGAYLPLASDGMGTLLELEAVLSDKLPALNYDGQATAQFQVIYTLSPLNDSGKPLEAAPYYESGESESNTET